MVDTPAVANFAVEPGTPRLFSAAGTAPRWWRSVWSDAGGRLAISFVAVMVTAGLFAPLLAPFDPLAQLGLVELKSRPPSVDHWFGTDTLSRDVLSRMLFGARISLRVAVLAAGLSGGVGLIWGASAGFLGGAIDAALTRVVDALLAIPRVLLVLTVLALWPEVTAGGLITVLGLTGWFGVSRLARAQAIGVRRHDFVVAAQALGASRVAVLVRHVLPHALGPVLVASTVAVGHVLVLEAGLSYLGLGVRPPTPTWGSIIENGSSTLRETWWLTLFPGLALIGTSLAVNAIANRLRAAINPRQFPSR